MKNKNQLTKIGKTLKGVIVSTKMAKTVVVLVSRYVKVPIYGKYIKRSKRYKVHDPEGRGVLGAEVKIKETKPISKDKHFVLID